jgi:hypothetical protein
VVVLILRLLKVMEKNKNGFAINLNDLRLIAGHTITGLTHALGTYD